MFIKIFIYNYRFYIYQKIAFIIVLYIKIVQVILKLFLKIFEIMFIRMFI